MKSLNLFLVFFALSLFTLTSCGGSSDPAEDSSSEEQSEQQEEQKSEDNTNASTSSSSTSSLGKGEEVMDFRKLKEIMPEEINGMERTNHGGEKVGAMGYNMSNAKASYQDGDKRVEVNVTDIGGFSSALAGMAAWSTLEVDRESDEEVERTYTVDGYKAFEKYNFKSKRGELSLIYEDRLIVNISGRNIERGDLEDIWNDLDMP